MREPNATPCRVLGVTLHKPRPVNGQAVALLEERREAHLVVPKMQQNCFPLAIRGDPPARPILIPASHIGISSPPRALEHDSLYHPPSSLREAGRTVLMLPWPSNLDDLFSRRCAKNGAGSRGEGRGEGSAVKARQLNALSWGYRDPRGGWTVRSRFSKQKQAGTSPATESSHPYGKQS